jgi:hypothetical protein
LAKPPPTTILEIAVNKKKKKDKGRPRMTTSLSGHTRVGKTLVPPMMSLPGSINFSSWSNERLPEMLWATLVMTVFPREDSLGTFREIASLGIKYREMGDECKPWSLNLSALAKQPHELIAAIVQIVKKRPLALAALRPLLLLESLPARNVWKTEIAADPVDDDWETLGKAVITNFDHQSQEATDIRWLRLMFKICLGAMLFAETMAERVEELRLYPNKGDMRSVRPFIRAGEMSVDMGPDGKNPKEKWPENFWRECMDRTTCVPAHSPKHSATIFNRKAFLDSLMDVRMSVVEHWGESLTTTAVEPRHDTVFGFALYALSCVLEMASVSNRHGISGRLFLRSLTECRITLAYLVHADDSELWKRFRSYGAGQAKLALLKMEEISGAEPSFVEKAMLEMLANEDFFQEFVEIDLGHWCGKDLRRMSEDSGTKDDYDKFYGWASGFVHGQWGALRDTGLTHCMNPLHRFHRVPLPWHRMMTDSLLDAVGLVNSMLESVEKVFPGKIERVALPVTKTETEEGQPEKECVENSVPQDDGPKTEGEGPSENGESV